MSSEFLYAALNTKFPTPKLKLIAVMLMSRVNTDAKCWPGYGTIAKDTGYSRRSAIVGVSYLERVGLLTKVRGEDGKSNTYIPRKAVREAGGRWHFEGMGYEVAGIQTTPVNPVHQCNPDTSEAGTLGSESTSLGSEAGSPLSSEATSPGSEPASPECLSNDQEKDPGKDPPNGPPAGGLAESTPAQAELKSQSPEPVTPSPADTLAILLAKKFWNWQGKPAKYKSKSSADEWAKEFHNLLNLYPDLDGRLTYCFEIDEFWKLRLIQSEDPLGYLKAKLVDTKKGSIHEKYMTYLARSGKSSPALPASPDSSPEQLWDFVTIATQAQRNLPAAQAYFQSHQKEYYDLHPDWIEDFKMRRIL